jgi:hypothetical protein
MDNLTIDRHKLVDYSIVFAEKLLIEFQEFFPFSATIDLDSNFIPTAFYDGNEHPSSQELFDQLKRLLDGQLNANEKRDYALTYNVSVRKDNRSDATDAIAIQIKHHESASTFTYYFAYRMTEKELEHLDSWGEID